ncbi:MAG: aldehyde ferredoxin oxidoreductase N-terminal domain-containing protein [Moorellales bacterium]
MLGANFIRVLKVDLGTGKCSLEDREDLFPYLGGVGVAARLLDENLHYDLDPLDPQQPLVFAIGPLSYVYPAVTKTCLMFYSPLTGELGESYAGGRSAFALRFAGLDALVITGRADKPVYLTVSSQGVKIKPAAPLWGASIEECGRYLRELEPGRGIRSTIRIGPAGEKRIRLANLNVDTFRHFGRLGAGAVFGAKNLKAVVILGDRQMPIPEPVHRSYRRLYRELYAKVLETDAMHKYHDLGTAANVVPLSRIGGLPTRNLRQARFEYAEVLSGEAFAEQSLVRQISCVGCPIGCIHVALLRRRFGPLHEWESVFLAYDHEPIFALGSFLGLNTREKFLTLLEKIEAAGLDVISTGVLLGWATEAYQQGLISREELGTPLEFGYLEGYLAAVEGLLQGGNDLYRTLARGTEHAASVYGGLDFALCLGKHEMTGYHTGYGALVGQAVGCRHSHLDNAGYALDQQPVAEDPQALVEAIYREERLRCALNSLVVCLFARRVYDLETAARALEALGIAASPEALWDLAGRILRLKLEIKAKMGFDFRGLRFPKRFFETETPRGRLDPAQARDLVERYLELLDRELGLPPAPLRAAPRQVPIRFS